MVIKQVSDNVVDVFIGLGWDNWSRMSRSNEGKWYMVAGKRLPAQAFNEFKKRVANWR